MISYRWTSALIGLLIAAAILYLIRRDHLHSRYAIWWLPMALGAATIGVFPGISDWMAGYLGIAYSPSLIIVIAIALILIKILLMDLERSRNERKLYRLVQRMALLEYELEQLRSIHDRPPGPEQGEERS